MPLVSMFPGAEALQGSVHVGGAHAASHRRETSQMHGELARAFAKPRISSGALHRASAPVHGIEGGTWWGKRGGADRVVRSTLVHDRGVHVWQAGARVVGGMAGMQMT